MDIHAIVRNPVIKKGTQPDLYITVYNNDGTEMDLSDSEVSIIVKRWHTGASAIIDQECVITEPTRGKCVACLSALDTSNWDVGRYLGEIEVIRDSTEWDRTENMAFWVQESLRS